MSLHLGSGALPAVGALSLLLLVGLTAAYPSYWANPRNGAIAVPDCVSHPNTSLGPHGAPTEDKSISIILSNMSSNRTDAICPGHEYQVQVSWSNTTASVAAMITASCGGPCGTFASNLQTNPSRYVYVSGPQCENRIMTKRTNETVSDVLTVSCSATGTLHIFVTSADATHGGFKTRPANFAISSACKAPVCASALPESSNTFEASSKFEASSEENDKFAFDPAGAQPVMNPPFIDPVFSSPQSSPPSPDAPSSPYPPFGPEPMFPDSPLSPMPPGPPAIQPPPPPPPPSLPPPTLPEEPPFPQQPSLPNSPLFPRYPLQPDLPRMPSLSPSPPRSPPDDRAVTTGSTNKGISPAIIGGAAAGASILLLMVGVCLYMRHRSSSGPQNGKQQYAAAPPGLAGGKEGPGKGSDRSEPLTCTTDASTGFVPDHAKGDYLLQASVAPFMCAAYQPSSQSVYVEADINDWHLDKLSSGNNTQQASGAPVRADSILVRTTTTVVTPPALALSPSAAQCSVIELSSEDVLDQLVLLPGEVLGRGATAVVMKCLWTKRFGPNALLAAKVLKNPYEAEAVILQSFSYEAALLASVRHPNVVRLYGFCLQPPTICLILELVPCTLKTRIYQPRAFPPCPSIMPSSPGKHTSSTMSSNTQPTSDEFTTDQTPSTTGAAAANPTCYVTAIDDRKQQVKPGSRPAQLQKLTMAEVIQISTDIAAGLAFLHDTTLASASGRHQVAIDMDGPPGEHVYGALNEPEGGRRIVHRDLKPANVLLNSLGRAKISDFGLARRHHSTTLHTVHPGAGTLAYMAPELIIARNARGYMTSPTNRVDIYSYAMLMWELLAGQVPYSGMTELQILNQVSNSRRPPLPRGPRAKPQQDQGAGCSSGGGGLDTRAPSSQPPTDQALPVPDLNTLPASLDALPQFNEIIAACWQQRDLRRPTAAAVHRMLVDLAQQFKS